MTRTTVAAAVAAAAEPTVPRKTAERDAEIAARVLRHWHEAVPNDRMAHLVKDATRAFLRALQGRLARHDVQLGHWSFLRILWQRDGLTKRELSIEAGVMEPTTFIALRAMESLGYVTLEQRAGNRKNVYVFLTPSGRGLRQTLVPLAEEVNAVALNGIEPAQIDATRRALLMMVDNLARDAAAGALAAAPDGAAGGAAAGAASPSAAGKARSGGRRSRPASPEAADAPVTPTRPTRPTNRSASGGADAAAPRVVCRRQRSGRCCRQRAAAMTPPPRHTSPS